MRLIDADALVGGTYYVSQNETFVGYTQQEIDRQPTVEMTEPKRGKWIRITNGAMREKYICSECGRQIEEDGIEGLIAIKYPYCHCGCKMIEPQESEDDECKGCYYNDGEVHAECVICDKAESEE